MSHTTFYENLAESLKNKAIKVVSFDFFDTLMSRRVPRPTDVFQLLAQRLLDKDLLAFAITPQRFEKLRVQAEALARKEEPSTEVTIEEIYARLPTELFKCSIAEAIVCELEVERELLFPVAEMVEIVNMAAARGKKIIVVSDIYFSPTQLKYLWGNTTPKVNIEFFTSATFRTGKYANLFPLVLKKLRVQASAVLHAGDNYVSDVKTPTTHGIATCFLPHGSSAFYGLLQSERPEMTPEYDLGLTAIRAKTASHMSNRSVDQTSLFRYGAQILGPVLSTFVHWVSATAKASGLQVVLPLLREGHIIGQLMDELPDGLDVRQTYLSRRVLFQAGLINADRATLGALRFGNLDASVEEFLRLVTLSSLDAPTLKHLLAKSIQDDAVFQYVLDQLCDAKYISLIRQRAADIRSGVLAHFLTQASVNGELPKQVGIVDIGWNGTIQRLLQDILHEERLDVQLHGMYLMTTATVNSLLMDGHLAKGFLIDGGVPHMEFELLSRTLEIFEQSCAPAHGSVSHHDPASGEPVLQPDRIPPHQRADIHDIQLGIALAHRLFVSNLPQDCSAAQLAGIAHLIRPILLRAMLAPTAEEASLFARWVHDDNLGSGSVMPILGTARLRQVLPYMTAQQLREIPMGELYWPAGAMAMLHEARCRENFAVTMAKLPGHLFDRQLPGSSELASSGGKIDHRTVDSFSNKIARPVYRNRESKAYVLYKLHIAENCGLRWMPLSGPFKFKIDQLVFEFLDAKGRRYHSVLTGSELQASVASTGIEWTGAGTCRGDGKNSAFYFDDLREFGIVGAGVLTLQVVGEIDEDVEPIAAMKPSYPRTLDLAAPVNLIPGECVLDSFNGEQIQAESPLVAREGISLNGWMVDSAFGQTEGEYFARFINLLGESCFVPMQGVARHDVAEHHANTLALTSGFSLSNCVLPAGNYALSIVRKGSESCIVSRHAWRITVDA